MRILEIGKLYRFNGGTKWGFHLISKEKDVTLSCENILFFIVSNTFENNNSGNAMALWRNKVIAKGIYGGWNIYNDSLQKMIADGTLQVLK